MEFDLRLIDLSPPRHNHFDLFIYLTDHSQSNANRYCPVSDKKPDKKPDKETDKKDKESYSQWRPTFK